MMYRIAIILMVLIYISGQDVLAKTVSLADVQIPDDAASLKEGAQLSLAVCNSCHNLRYLKYTNLLELGFSQQEVDSWRGDVPMSSRILSRASGDVMQLTYGLVPPDLSIIAKGRKGRGRYVYTLLTSYTLDENGELNNHLLPGVRMPDVLGWSQLTDEKERSDVSNRLVKVAAFLEWAADPNASKRESMGFYLIIYLIIMTFLLWLMKRRTWADVKTSK